MDLNNDDENHVVSTLKRKKKEAPVWDTKTHLVFIELCLKEAQRGNKPGTHFNKMGYVNLIKNIKERTGKDIQYKQIKNHWEAMKKDWKIYDRLMRIESGIGWDPIRKTIDATPEWWDEKIKADKELAKFRGENLEMYRLYYEPLFRDSVAVGDRTKTPHDIDLVDEEDEYMEGKGDSDEVNACNDEVPLFPESSSSKRKKSNGSRSTKGKDSTFEKRLDTVLQALSSRSAQSIQSHNSIPSTKDCMDVVVGYPGFEEGSQMYCEALGIFMGKQARENFMVPASNDAKMEFLKFMIKKQASKDV